MRGGGATIAAITERRSSYLIKSVSLGGLDVRPAPRPMAETSKPLESSLRFCINGSPSDGSTYHRHYLFGAKLGAQIRCPGCSHAPARFHREDAGPLQAEAAVDGPPVKLPANAGGAH